MPEVAGRDIEGACSPVSWAANHHEVRARVEVFFPDPHLDEDYVELVEFAKSVCASCGARDACLESGLHEQHGIWGGTTPDERRELRKEMRKR